MSYIGKETRCAPALALAAMIVLPSFARAETVGPLSTFNAGETARASEVNYNFDAVKSAVDDNDARIVVLENDPQVGNNFPLNSRHLLYCLLSADPKIPLEPPIPYR